MKQFAFVRGPPWLRTSRRCQLTSGASRIRPRADEDLRRPCDGRHICEPPAVRRDDASPYRGGSCGSQGNDRAFVVQTERHQPYRFREQQARSVREDVLCSLMFSLWGLRRVSRILRGNSTAFGGRASRTHAFPVTPPCPRAPRWRKPLTWSGFGSQSLAVWPWHRRCRWQSAKKQR
jgi:hypothetical protein